MKEAGTRVLLSSDLVQIKSILKHCFAIAFLGEAGTRVLRKARTEGTVNYGQSQNGCWEPRHIFFDMARVPASPPSFSANKPPPKTCPQHTCHRQRAYPSASEGNARTRVPVFAIHFQKNSTISLLACWKHPDSAPKWLRRPPREHGSGRRVCIFRRNFKKTGPFRGVVLTAGEVPPRRVPR
jgi:hypothetical protein